MVILYLVRHGENKANITKEFSYKKVDYPLTEIGRQQALQTAEYLAKLPIKKIYCSPLARAVQTAEIIGSRLQTKPKIMEEFREINVGHLEGKKPTKELWEKYSEHMDQWWIHDRDFRIPGGETYTELSNRMLKGLTRILQENDFTENEEILVVGHGGIFNLTLRDICQNIGPQEIRNKYSHNCAISTLQISLKEGKIHGELMKWADFAHLSGKALTMNTGVPEA